MPYDELTEGEAMQEPNSDGPRRRVDGLSEGIDPTMFSVLLHAIGQASDEMTRVLQRGARSTIISIARDHSASIYTAEAQMLYQNDALPIHTIGGGLNVEAVVDEFGDDIHDGDVFMINDPYMGTTHNSDLTVIMPVFHEDRHLFWTSIRAHQNNTGEASFGHASTSVWQDGIQIPPVRIFERGKEVRSIIRFYLRNVRLPEWLEADLRAMVGSVRTGAARLQEMTRTHGVDTVLATIDEMIEYSDRRTAAEIRALPDGVYKGESWIDSDGQGTHDIRIACTVTIEDDMVSVDYSESDPQVGGHCNSSLASLRANGSIPVLTTIDPTIPRNEGCMRHIRVIAREGTVALGKWPASTWWSTTNPGDELIEAAWKALAQAAPDRVPAGWGRIQQRLSMGDDYRTDPPTPFAASIFVAGSGGGGSSGYDGWPLTQCVCALGGLQNESVEMVELLQPLFIESNQFLIDSAGAGEWIGGHGCETVVMPYHGLLYMKFEYEGTLNPPFGLFGGLPGNGGCKYKETPDGKRYFYQAHPDPDAFREGERYVCISSGGGGYGSALDRPADSVWKLVRDELVSPEMARERFGVVLDPEALTVDEQATEALRHRMRKTADRSLSLPTGPGAGEFWKTRFRDGDELVVEETPVALKLGLSPEAR